MGAGDPSTAAGAGSEPTDRPPYETFKHPTCRGSMVLGTACGTCEKCAWERARFAQKASASSNAPHPASGEGTLALKPCPFCGGKALMLQWNDKSYVTRYTTEVHARVVCPECDAQVDYAHGSQAIAKAATIWNERVSHTEPERADEPVSPFALRGADRLASEVNALVRSGKLGARTPAADALLDYCTTRFGQDDPIGALEATSSSLCAEDGHA